ncbi:MAG: TlpA disulfide reductase family protein, partial [Pseudomonadota bacterium]
VKAQIAGLRHPMGLLKLMMMIGGAGALYALLSATYAPPKPWENTAPVYAVGEMAKLERIYPAPKMPAVRLDKDGGTVRLGDYAQGAPLVVNLWATWCAPCLEELPALQTMQNELGGRVKVLAVAMESGDGSAQRAMLKKVGADQLTFVQDPSLSLMGAYGRDLQLPLTILYDGRGREVARLSGAADWGSPEALRLLKAIASGRYPN